MGSSIVVPTLAQLAGYPPQIAAFLIAQLTNAQNDINAGQLAVAAPVASVTALAAITAANRTNGTTCLVLSDASGQSSWWQFVAASTATDATNNLVVSPSAGSGAWVRVCGPVCLSIPVTFSTANSAVIFTMPTGARFHPREAWWDVSTSWTGGSSSAIGVATSVTGFTAAGCMLGGTGGDVAATLVSTATRETGTIGTDLATRTLGRLIMVAADTFVFNQITSAFTAGAANVRVLGDLILNTG